MPGPMDIANKLAGYFSDAAKQGQDYAENTLGKDQYDKDLKGSMNMAMGTIGGAPESEVGTLQALFPEAKNAKLFDKAWGAKEGESPEFLDHLVGGEFHISGAPYKIQRLKAAVPNENTAVELIGPGKQGYTMSVKDILDKGVPK